MIVGCAALLAVASHAEEAADALPLPSFRTKREPMPRLDTAAFRVAIPAGPPSASARVAFVQDFDGASIAELTLRGGYAWRSFGFAVELAGTAAASDSWSGAGLGNTVLDVRGLFGGRVTHALGLRGIFPTGNRTGPHGPVAWWGTVPDATVPMTGVALVYEGASPRSVWHLRLGLHGRVWDFGLTSELIDASIGVAVIQPIAERWEVVLEMEAMNGESPLHLRALARHDFGHGWEVDVGMTVPVAVFFADPTLQVIGRVERRW